LGPGQFIRQPAPAIRFFVIGDLSTVWAGPLFVRESEAADVRVGQEIEFTRARACRAVPSRQISITSSAAIDPSSRRLSWVRAHHQTTRRGLFKTRDVLPMRRSMAGADYTSVGVPKTGLDSMKAIALRLWVAPPTTNRSSSVKSETGLTNGDPCREVRSQPEGRGESHHQGQPVSSNRARPPALKNCNRDVLPTKSENRNLKTEIQPEWTASLPLQSNRRFLMVGLFHWPSVLGGLVAFQQLNIEAYPDPDASDGR